MEEGLSVEAGLLAALEQLETVEAALLADPTDAGLLRLQAELTELLALSSLVYAQPTAGGDHDDGSGAGPAAAEAGQEDKGVADMFGGDDDEWERTHEREFALHTERRRQAFVSSSSSAPTASHGTATAAAAGSSATAKRKRDDGDDGQGDDGQGGNGDADQEAGWLSCRVVVTETAGHGRQRKVLREGLLHSRRPDEAGRYRVTLLHSRLTQEVRSEDVLLQGATLKHLNHDPTASASERRRRERPPRRRSTDGGGDSEDDLSTSDSDADGFEGFSLMHATGGHDYVVGKWESHTSGIGSRLLAKMGYTPGKGLGRGGEGIVKPLGIGLKAPSRKKELLGLGHDERNRRGDRGGNEGGDDDDGGDRNKQAFDEEGNPIPRKRRRRGGRKNKNNRKDDNGEGDARSDIFGFLNEIGQVGGGGGGGADVRLEKTSSSSKKKDDAYKKMSAAELQESLKKRIIEKDDVSRKIQQLEESVQRNKSKDPAMAAQAKQRMREARTRLHALHSEIKELSTRVKIKEGAKKTIVF